MDANQSSDPGLVLVLFALVRSSPPATVSFVDQSGQLVANTSDFLLLDSQTHPWLANHTLRILLSSLSGNLSLQLSHSVGPVQSNLTLAGGRARVCLTPLDHTLVYALLPHCVPRVPAVPCGGAHAGDRDRGGHGPHGPAHPDLHPPLPHAEEQEQVFGWDSWL